MTAKARRHALVIATPEAARPGSVSVALSMLRAREIEETQSCI
jgi:hypothetical protein